MIEKEKCCKLEVPFGISKKKMRKKSGARVGVINIAQRFTIFFYFILLLHVK